MIKLNISFHHPEHSDDRINQSLSEIFAGNTLLSMATPKNSQESWINTVYYAYNAKLDLYFMTQANTQHVTNLQSNSSVAVSIFDSHQQPTDNKRGIQLFGTWELAKGSTLEEGTKVYGERFIWLFNYIKNIEDWKTTTLHSRIYVIHIRTIKIFDEILFGPELWVTIDMP